MSAAAANSKEMPADFRVSITNAPGATSYPISSFTWLLIPSEIKDPAKKKAITDFLGWMLTTGQKDCEGSELCAASEGRRGQRAGADQDD